MVKIWQYFRGRFLLEERVCQRHMTDEKRNIGRKDNQRLPSYFLRITLKDFCYEKEIQMFGLRLCLRG